MRKRAAILLISSFSFAFCILIAHSATASILEEDDGKAQSLNLSSVPFGYEFRTNTPFEYNLIDDPDSFRIIGIALLRHIRPDLQAELRFLHYRLRTPHSFELRLTKLSSHIQSSLAVGGSAYDPKKINASIAFNIF